MKLGRLLARQIQESCYDYVLSSPREGVDLQGSWQRESIQDGIPVNKTYKLVKWDDHLVKGRAGHEEAHLTITVTLRTNLTDVDVFMRGMRESSLLPDKVLQMMKVESVLMEMSSDGQLLVGNKTGLVLSVNMRTRSRLSGVMTFSREGLHKQSNDMDQLCSRTEAHSRTEAQPPRTVWVAMMHTVMLHVCREHRSHSGGGGGSSSSGSGSSLDAVLQGNSFKTADGAPTEALRFSVTTDSTEVAEGWIVDGPGENCWDC